MVLIRFIISGCIAVCLFSSCRSTKKIQTAIAKKDTATIPIVVAELEKEDTSALIAKSLESLQKNKIDYTTFSAKADVDYQDPDGKNYNVNAHIRMYKDSVIWVSITAIFGIEGLRAYITKDSVKIIDKQNKKYVARSVSYLQEVTALPLSLASLQDLLVGNPVFVGNDVVNYFQKGELVNLLTIGEFFKNLISISSQNGLMQNCKLDDIDDMRNRTSYLSYFDYELNNGTQFSTKRAISVTDKKKLDIQINFKQYDFNETLTFPFSVNKNYKKG